jgi:hypothetical protein
MQDKNHKTGSKSPELFKTTPRKSNSLAFLGTEPFKRGTFIWYSNPQIGYKHVIDPSKKVKIGKSKEKIGKSIGVNAAYPFTAKH